ncbi:MAG TPA: TonB family protein [Candidatus Paceibacterota bacterium]|nr:TonB family protein [Candidatus Paceibacterota bacterium]
MKRVQYQCLAASTVAHSLLVLIVFLGIGFGSAQKREVDLPILEVIPSRLVDEAVFGGGDPRPPGPENKTPERQALPAAPANPPPIKPQPASEPPPSKPEPAPKSDSKAPPEKPIDPPKAAEPAKPFPSDEPSPAPVKTPPKKARNIDLSQRKTRSEVSGIVPRNTQRAQQEAADKARREAIENWRGQISGALGSIRRNLSSSTTIEVSGGGVGGTGGEAYANYAQVIRTLYDRAWIDPEEVADSNLSVRAAIVIARDGRILSSRLVRPSGVAAMDKSVRQALDRVTRVPAFPAESKDIERTFNINFNLKAKRSLG